MQTHTTTLASIVKHDIVSFTHNGTEYKGEVTAIARAGGRVDLDIHNGTISQYVGDLPRNLTALVYI